MPRTASALLLVAALATVALPAIAADEAAVERAETVASAADLEMPASEMSLADARVVTLDDASVISLSPDGRMVAVVRQTSGSSAAELCVLDLDSLEDIACAGLAPLQAGLRPDDVTWSPDGRFLAFTERAFEVLMDGDLWLMDTASGRLTNLLDDGFEGPLPMMQAPAPRQVHESRRLGPVVGHGRQALLLTHRA